VLFIGVQNIPAIVGLLQLRGHVENSLIVGQKFVVWTVLDAAHEMVLEVGQIVVLLA